ncbi:YdcP family protein [Ligilactobacillus agilis]|uniref:YdcP family protein n=1 Tax=Ligilactobacillus agilis TaxID=1601 RepID=UPI00255C3146|nr:YdcP family protein [Ligilactobacillus agilis]
MSEWNGIVLDKEKTFGVLKFSALRHEVRIENEDGTTSEKIKHRTYDLKCSQQERTIQVPISAKIPVKDYPYNAEVELINPGANTVANDIVLKNKVKAPIKNDICCIKLHNSL